MDLTSILINSMLSEDSIKSLSKKTGSSKDEVSSVLSAALPMLLKGAGRQAEDESTAESFSDALDQHAEDDTSDMETFMDNVDTADGAKILAHLLGAETESTTKKVSKKSGTSDENTAQILTAAAPLLMSVLGQENKKSKKKKSKKASDDLVGALLGAAIENVNVTELLMGALTDSLTDTEEKPATKKKAASSKRTTAKKSAAKKSTVSKKSTAAKKRTAKKSTATKKKAASKKKAADDKIDAGDVANLLTKLLK
ncbi:MAG: DUF937 domain-containing protein [Oscillospiraceae bacterium]|nr:DUF937 domain-containing protein [Oscillospiraceae bacterium]